MIGSVPKPKVAYMGGVQTLQPQPSREDRRQLLIDDDPHAAMMTG